MFTEIIKMLLLYFVCCLFICMPTKVLAGVFTDECDTTAFNSAFFRNGELLVLKNPYLYTWRPNKRPTLEGRITRKAFKYEYWPQIADNITAACTVERPNSEWWSIFMHNVTGYIYLERMVDGHRQNLQWTFQMSQIQNHQFFVPTCMTCVHSDDRNGPTVTFEFTNRDLTEVRRCSATLHCSWNNIECTGQIACINVLPTQTVFITDLKNLLKDDMPCGHFAKKDSTSGVDLVFTRRHIIVNASSKVYIVPLGPTLYGCRVPSKVFSQAVLGIILWITSVSVTMLPMWYFLLTKPGYTLSYGSISRSRTRSKGGEGASVHLTEADIRRQMSKFSPIRDRPTGKQQKLIGVFSTDEDTVRTVISTG